MLVRDYMSAPAVTITLGTPFQEAMKLMHEHHVRRLPVVDEAGELVGIISERDMLYASPSPTTLLSVWELILLISKLQDRKIMPRDIVTTTPELDVWELAYLLSRLQIEEIMSRDIVTTTPDTMVQDAASLIVDNKIGGLPVVDENNHVVGVITETDILKTWVEMVRCM